MHSVRDKTKLKSKSRITPARFADPMFRHAILVALSVLLLSADSARADDAKAPAKAEQAPAAPQPPGGLLEQVAGKFRLAPVDIKPRDRAPLAAPPAAPAPVVLHGIAMDVAVDFVVVEGAAMPLIAAPQPAVPAQPADAGDLNPQEQQILTQVFQPLLDRELAFVRKSCGLDDVQATSLADAVKPQLKTVVREYFKSMQQPRRVVRVNGIQRVEPAQAMPNKLMEKCIAETVAKVKLPADKAAAYADEVARRAAFNKQAGVEAFVAAIDDRVMLDDAQREKLAAALTKNWDESWAPYLQTLLYANNFNPPVPNEILFPILRQNQKEVWQTPNQNGQIFFNGRARFNFAAPVDVF
jgi:hypothetical protein